MINQHEFEDICEDFTLVDPDEPSEIAAIKTRLQNLANAGLEQVLKPVLEAFILLDDPQKIEDFGNLLLEVQEHIRDQKFNTTIANTSTPANPLPTISAPDIPTKSAPDIPKSTPVASKEVLNTVEIVDTTNYADLFNQDLELVQTFCEESMEHLDTIDLKIIIWEKNPYCEDCVNDIFRPFHTIKGVSSFLDLKDIQKVAHALEDLLDDARSEQIKYSPQLSAVIFRGVDHLKSMINCIVENIGREKFQNHNVPVEAFVQEIKAFPRLPVPDKSKNMLDAKQEAPSEISLSELSAKGLLDASDLQQLGLSEEDDEPQEWITAKPLEAKPSEAKPSEAEPSEAEPSEAEPSEKTIHTTPEQTTKVIPAPVAKIPEIKPTTNPPIKPKNGEKKTALHKIQQEMVRSVKIDINKLDALIDQVGELVISNNILSQYLSNLQITDKGFLAEISQLRRIVNSLQYSSLSLRMIPIANTFQKMNRVVRDLGVKLGKDLNLELIGENTEIDRNIVDELYEPLVHLIRNAGDHAIENPEERRQTGKKPVGTITLEAGHRDGCIQISIKDDGRGLDTQKIRRKAVSSGLISENEEITKEEIFRLILRPGFSTAESVSNVSGRGVGMDVVVKAIEKFRGKVEIQSEMGKGSTFSIKVPLTLAIIDGMIIRVGKQQFIVPTINIRESIRPNRADYNETMGRGEMVTVRGNLIPLLRLHQIFSIPEAIYEPWEALVVVVEADNKNYAILVDQLLGKQEIVIKSLGEKFQGLPGVAGGAILGNGHVGLILDIPQLVQLNESSFF